MIINLGSREHPSLKEFKILPYIISDDLPGNNIHRVKEVKLSSLSKHLYIYCYCNYIRKINYITSYDNWFGHYYFPSFSYFKCPDCFSE